MKPEKKNVAVFVHLSLNSCNARRRPLYLCRVIQVLC